MSLSSCGGFLDRTTVKTETHLHYMPSSPYFETSNSTAGSLARSHITLILVLSEAASPKKAENRKPISQDHKQEKHEQE